MDWKWSLMKHSHSPLLPFISPIYTHSSFPFQLSHTELHFPILPSLAHSCTFNLTMSNSNSPPQFPSNDSSSNLISLLDNVPTIYEQEPTVLPHSFADLGGSSFSNFEEYLCTAPGTNERGSFVDGNLGSSEYSTGNRSQLSGLERLKDVEEPQEENYVEESENALPKLGMEFSTEEEAKKFFRDDYGKKIGFQVRMGDRRTLKNGSIKRDFWCSRYKSLGKRKGITKANCDSRFQITYEKKKWVVSLLNVEHNHELEPPLLHTEQADGATFNVESINISTESRKRPNEVPFDKSKTMKHIGSLLGSQKVEEQKVNTHIYHSVGRPVDTVEEADAIFADIGQVTSCVSSQATSSKKRNFSEETISGAKMIVKKYLHMKLEDLVHPDHKPVFMNTVETLIHSNVLSKAQNSVPVELHSNLLKVSSLEEVMSEFQKSLDSRTALINYLNRAHLEYKNFRAQVKETEMEILKLEEQLKKMQESKVGRTLKMVELAHEVQEKKYLLVRFNSEFPSLKERKKKAVDAFEQASSSWEDNKKYWRDF